MFTGIIEEVGEVVEISDSDPFRIIRVRAQTVLRDLQSGSSLAINGVCLTAKKLLGDIFLAEMSRETLERTTLGRLKAGSPVNLERPVRLESRLGGHIVQGHVDGVGRIRKFDRRGDVWDLEIETPPGNARYLVEKGSIAVDGISLTVAALRGDGAFSTAIIPHTFENTNLRTTQRGEPVNLEFDILAKYIENLLKPYGIRNS